MPSTCAWEALQEDPDLAGLELADAQGEAFVADAAALVDDYFQLEDPTPWTPSAWS